MFAMLLLPGQGSCSYNPTCYLNPLSLLPALPCPALRCRDHVRVLPDGEAISQQGTHLGHNLPDRKGNRYDGSPSATACRDWTTAWLPATACRYWTASKGWHCAIESTGWAGMQMVAYYHTATALWYCTATALWYDTATAFWYCTATAFWYYTALVPPRCPSPPPLLTPVSVASPTLQPSSAPPPLLPPPCRYCINLVSVAGRPK